MHRHGEGDGLGPGDPGRRPRLDREVRRADLVTTCDELGRGPGEPERLRAELVGRYEKDAAQALAPTATLGVDPHGERREAAPQGLFDLFGSLGPGEQEPEVAVAGRPRRERPADGDGDLEPPHPRHREGGRGAVDPGEAARDGDGKHHHARGARHPGARQVDVSADRVRKHDLLEGTARREAERLRATPADRPRRSLEDDDPPAGLASRAVPGEPRRGPGRRRGRARRRPTPPSPRAPRWRWRGWRDGVT